MGIEEYSQEQLERPATGRATTIAAPVSESLALEAMQLAEGIAHRWGTSPELMLANGPGCRAKHLASARAELYVALRARGWSYPSIGRFVGGRHHSTVLSALRTK